MKRLEEWCEKHIGPCYPCASMQLVYIAFFVLMVVGGTFMVLDLRNHPDCLDPTLHPHTCVVP